MFKAVAEYPGATIGKRVSAKNAVIREALGAYATEEAVNAFVDAWEAAEEVRGGSMRGGAETADAIRDVVRNAVANTRALAGAVDSAFASVIRGAGASAKGVGAVIAASTVLNHPTLIGDVAQLSANVLSATTNAAITSTWGDWGLALASLGRSVGSVLGLTAGQIAQGPVVPVAIATAIMAWRAQQRGISIPALLTEDAAGAWSGVMRGVTSQIQAFQTGREKGAIQKAAAQLKELGNIAKGNRPAGEGALEIAAAAVGAPLMAVERGPAVELRGPEALPSAVSVVAKKGKPFSEALEGMVKSPKAVDVTRQAIQKAREVGAEAAESAAAMSEQAARRGALFRSSDREVAANALARMRGGPGGKRKTQKRKGKRRATRRQVIKFAY